MTYSSANPESVEPPGPHAARGRPRRGSVDLRGNLQRLQRAVDKFKEKLDELAPGRAAREGRGR